MTDRRLMLVVDPIACAGHGVCAELLPEQIATDPWGYPLVSPDDIPTSRLDRAPTGRRPVSATGHPPGGASSVSQSVRARPSRQTIEPDERSGNRRPAGLNVRRGRPYRRRRLKVAGLLVLIVFLGWLGISLGGALTNPALGGSVGARFAEWARGHGGRVHRQLGGERVVQPSPAQGRRRTSRRGDPAPRVDSGHGGHGARPSTAATADRAPRQSRRCPARVSGRRPGAGSAGSRPST